MAQTLFVSRAGTQAEGKGAHPRGGDRGGASVRLKGLLTWKEGGVIQIGNQRITAQWEWSLITQDAIVNQAVLVGGLGRRSGGGRYQGKGSCSSSHMQSARKRRANKGFAINAWMKSGTKGGEVGAQKGEKKSAKAGSILGRGGTSEAFVTFLKRESRDAVVGSFLAS